MLCLVARVLQLSNFAIRSDTLSWIYIARFNTYFEVHINRGAFIPIEHGAEPFNIGGGTIFH